jgi:dihydrodipicolinate synthase/N-acetylneuraminate lyase
LDKSDEDLVEFIGVDRVVLEELETGGEGCIIVLVGGEPEERLSNEHRKH